MLSAELMIMCTSGDRHAKFASFHASLHATAEERLLHSFQPTLGRSDAWSPWEVQVICEFE
jgi:hypothetical protein